MIQKYLKDIQEYVEAIPYGDVSVNVKRVGRKTTHVDMESKETLRYTDSESAVSDVSSILESLSRDGYSGSTNVQCEYRNGQIVMVTIHDKIQIQY